VETMMFTPVMPSWKQGAMLSFYLQEILTPMPCKIVN